MSIAGPGLISPDDMITSRLSSARLTYRINVRQPYLVLKPVEMNTC